MNNEAKPELLSRNVLLVLLIVCLAAIGAVVFLVLRPGQSEPEKIISVIEPAVSPEATGEAVSAPEPAPTVNVLTVEDAMDNPSAVAKEGHRYKVLIVDQAREGASGIARIGGLVTFVPDTQKGDVVIVEVTEVKRSTANAVVVEKLASGHVVPERTASSRPRDDRPRDRAPSALVGNTYRGTVEGVGEKGDGIVRVNKKVVFVPGVVKGEHVEFKVIDDMGQFAQGELIGKSDTPYPDEVASERSAESCPRGDKPPAPVAVGDEHVVTITEADRTNPTKNGVTRIEKFVVFVPDTQPGDRVRIRIAELRPRSANAEVIERLPAEAAPDAPSAEAPAP